jgi:hypothetical protein
MRQRLCYRMDLALVALLVLLVVKQAHALAHTYNSMYRKVIHGGACSLVVNRSQWHHVHIGTSEESQIQSCQHLNSVRSSASKLLKLLLFVRCLRVLRSSPLATPHHTEPCPYHMFALSHLPYNTYHYNHRHCSICPTVATTLLCPTAITRPTGTTAITLSYYIHAHHTCHHHIYISHTPIVSQWSSCQLSFTRWCKLHCSTTSTILSSTADLTYTSECTPLRT